MNALWMLSSRSGPATFDFATWLAIVKKHGATRIVIDDKFVRTKKFPEHVIRRRIETIIEPMPALAGLPWARGNQGQIFGSYLMSDLAALGEFERLKTVLPPKAVRYTVTLRNYHHHAYRNSDEKLWREFAKRIGARVIPDFADEPIHLHERMALYAGARMNFGVTNGPLWMIFLSPYPVAMYGCGINAPLWLQHGIKPGTQLPWALPNQRLIWEAPTMDSLMKAIEHDAT
jgi:hypothetical protein